MPPLEEAMRIRGAAYAFAVVGALAALSPARGETTLRIAMTASDIPTTTVMPNNGFEGMRFLGFPVFEGLVLWDLSRADRLPARAAGLGAHAERAAVAT